MVKARRIYEGVEASPEIARAMAEHDVEHMRTHGGFTDEYLEYYKTSRVLESVCSYYNPDWRSCFGKDVAPCHDRCDPEHGNPNCSHDWT